MLATPKMVAFDFGGTLVYDGEFKPGAGLEALRLAADNPNVTTTDAMLGLWREIFTEVRGKSQYRTEFNFDFPLSAVLTNIFTRLGLKYSISMDNCETVFDKFNSTRSTAPNIKQLLLELKDRNIKTCVISNIAMTGKALKASIDEILPGNGFSFIITSRDYIVCKPSRDMFEAAVKKAGLSPEQCWYCGDVISTDVAGALNAGLSAVHYDVSSPVGLQSKQLKGKEYVAVNNWQALKDYLRAL